MMLVLLIPVVVVATIVGTGWIWQSVYDFYPLESHSWVWVWNYIWAYKALPPFLLWSLYGAGGAIIGQLVLLMVLASQIGGRTLHGGRDDKSLHGTAQWARKRDVKEAGLWRQAGVVVGGWQKWCSTKFLRHDGPEHILAFAPTRSGKGVGLVLTTLLSWLHSVLVLDIKGENWRLTSGWRASLGHRILKFDPTAENGSVRYNPLAEIRLGTGHEIADAQNIAVMIIDPDGKGLADFWAKSGYAWLTGAILYTLYKIRRDEGRVATLPDVDSVLTSVGDGLDGLLADMVAFQADTEAATKLIRSAAQEMQDRAAQERSGVQSSSKVDLSLYRDPIIAKNISTSDFSLNDLMNGPTPVALYLIVPPADIDRLRPMLRIIMNLYLRRLMQNVGADGKPAFKHRLLLLMDEFTSLGKLEIFERSLAFMAGYGIKAFLIIQDLLQLMGAYGRENSIVGNCHVRIAYAPNDVTTAKTLSDMCGKTTIVSSKKSVNRKPMAFTGNITENMSEVGRPLLTPDECMRLRAPKKSKDETKIIRAGDMLTFVAGHNPILGRQPLYFQNKTLLARSLMPPVGGATEPGATPPANDDGEDLTCALPAGAAGIADRLRASVHSN